MLTLVKSQALGVDQHIHSINGRGIDFSQSLLLTNAKCLWLE